jgi:hypothetical protein
VILQKTARRIWNCYREIAAAEKILDDMAELAKRHPYDEHEAKLTDAFGHAHDLQLGIPSGENGHRLFDVRPELAASVIRAHIAAKKAELVEANEAARIEVGAV